MQVDFIYARGILNPLFMNKWQKTLSKMMNLEEGLWNYQILNYYEENSYLNYEDNKIRNYELKVGYKVNVEIIGMAK